MDQMSGSKIKRLLRAMCLGSGLLLFISSVAQGLAYSEVSQTTFVTNAPTKAVPLNDDTDIKNSLRQTTKSRSTSATKHYDAFGNVTSSSGSWLGPFQYGGPFGYQRDADSGLMILGHRYYDSTTGRFLSSDPAGHGRNWYAYCANNPVSFADGEGLKRMIIIIGTGIQDKTHKEPVISQADLQLAKLYKAHYERQGRAVDQPLLAPTLAEVKPLLAKVDGVIAIAHAPVEIPGVRLIGEGPKYTGVTKERLTPAAILQARKGIPLDLLILEACHQGSDANRREWVKAANWFAAYAEGADIAKRVKEFGNGTYGPHGWWKGKLVGSK